MCRCNWHSADSPRCPFPKCRLQFKQYIRCVIWCNFRHNAFVRCVQRYIYMYLYLTAHSAHAQTVCVLAIFAAAHTVVCGIRTGVSAQMARAKNVSHLPPGAHLPSENHHGGHLIPPVRDPNPNQRECKARGSPYSITERLGFRS